MKVALVTGAGQGIGRAIALRLARDGFALAMADINPSALAAVTAEIEAAGGQALALPADLSQLAEVQRVVAAAAAGLGRLDVLVNNAGVMLLGPIENAPTEEWRRMIHVNLFGVLYCTHAALPIMHSQGEGHIVNVSSVAGRVARAGSGVYNLTKFGVGAFSESLRQECVAMGVRVSVIEPGAVATELAAHNRPEVLEQMAKRFAGVTRLSADEIADAILYTISRPPNVSVNEVLIRPSGQLA
jgi:NADP-dependent 3-hydroxy acid dehydrogenase YdfG